MLLGPGTESPYQDILEPTDKRGTLPSSAIEALITPPLKEISQYREPMPTMGNTPPIPLEASTEPQAQLGSESTSIRADNNAMGSPGMDGNIANGTDLETSTMDSTRITPIPHTSPQERHPKEELPPTAVPDYPTLPLGTKEWPHLPELST